MRLGRTWLVWGPAALAVVGLVFVPRVQAEPVASFDGQAVSVRAEQLDIDVQKGTATLTGNVVLERGDLTVSCARVEARYDSAPNITWAIATGGVRAQARGIEAQAQEAELLLGQRRLVLRGGVRVARGGAWMTAREAAIDLETRRVRLEQVQGAIPVPSAAPSAIPGAAASSRPGARP